MTRMTRKNWTLIILAILLGGFSLYLNRDWFASENIHIYHRSRPARAGFFGRRRATNRPDDSKVDPVMFGFEHRLKLTSLKVIPMSDLETNKYPHPIWHLISDSNSVPTKEFVYGFPIPGMRPAIKGTSADALVPGEKYRLLIETAAQKAEHDFAPVARTP
jgi:hypothetical protein